MSDTESTTNPMELMKSLMDSSAIPSNVFSLTTVATQMGKYCLDNLLTT